MKKVGVPTQEPAFGVTVILPTNKLPVVFSDLNAAIFPAPNEFKPMEEDEFVQSKTAPKLPLKN